MKFLFELFNQNQDAESLRQQSMTLTFASATIIAAISCGLGVREANEYLDTACKDTGSRVYATFLCPTP